MNLGFVTDKSTYVREKLLKEFAARAKTWTLAAQPSKEIVLQARPPFSFSSLIIRTHYIFPSYYLKEKWFRFRPECGGRALLRVLLFSTSSTLPVSLSLFGSNLRYNELYIPF